ncbi:MAG: hypothetical protein K6G41_00805 [Bacteroidales bacterium]|nr:hypothetical protein [Bacteroidales bacterium]
MKKLTSIFVCLILGVTSVFAQNAFVGGHRAWTFALEGGTLYSINENRFTYPENGRGADLWTLQGSAAIGYEFTEALGFRVSVGYGNNASACNSRETASHGFYPYQFKSLNGFVDCTLDLTRNYGKPWAFHPVLYAGLGFAHTYDFTDAKHPWQSQYMTFDNYVFGFRGGFIAEYDFTDWFGIYADLCCEFYRDSYNGLQPRKEDQSQYVGYAGFPFDLRMMASFGILFRINY